MKTRVVVTSDSHQCMMKTGDVGYIDGYVQAADSCPYAVMVRDSDGAIDMVPTYHLKATDLV